jgi:hypothetical protein
MYAVIRRYKFDPREREGINRKVQEGFVPLIQKTAGFVAYYWLDQGDGVGASLSVFEDQAGADASVQIAADFSQKNSLAAIVGTPEVTKGEVKAHATR